MSIAGKFRTRLGLIEAGVCAPAPLVDPARLCEEHRLVGDWEYALEALYDDAYAAYYESGANYDSDLETFTEGWIEKHTAAIRCRLLSYLTFGFLMGVPLPGIRTPGVDTQRYTEVPRLLSPPQLVIHTLPGGFTVVRFKVVPHLHWRWTPACHLSARLPDRQTLINSVIE